MRPCRIGVLQHHPAEGPGRILQWAQRHGLTMDLRDATQMFGQGPVDTTALGWDALIVLGGPWFLDQAPDWLQSEVESVKAWIKAEKPCLGICLGSQIMALAMGATVAPIATPEYGWVEIELATHARMRPEQDMLQVPQWHEHGFTLPPGTTSMAWNQACPSQGFRRSGQWAVQFHPEWDDNALSILRAAFADAMPANLSIKNETAQREVATWFEWQLDQWRDTYFPT